MPTRQNTALLDELKKKVATLEEKLQEKERQLSVIAQETGARKAIIESEERFRLLYDRSLAYQSLDADGRLLDVNQTWLDELGYRRDEVIGRWFGDFLPPAYVEAFRQRFPEFKKAGEVHNEFEMKRKDGSIILTAFDGRISYDADGNFARTHCIFHNITERKQTKERLRQSEQRIEESKQLLTSILDTTHMMAVFLDPQFHFIWVNRAYADACRRPSAFFVGKNHFELYPNPENQQIFQRVVDTGQPFFTVGKPFEFPDQQERGVTYWDWSLIPILSAGSLVTGLVFTLVDVTDRVKAEKERQKLQEQFMQAQKMESIGRLAGGVAHDFNNMLNVIMGHAQLAMLKSEPESPLFAHLEEIEKAAARSGDLTRQLLAFARKQTVSPKVLDLNDTLEGMLKMLRRLIGENIELVWMPGAGLWPVKVDPAQIDQILANLCVNARDAINGAGKITIETRNEYYDTNASLRVGAAAGSYVSLTISDNGCGMDKQILDRLFEPFFTTKEVGKGTGLGLATVYGAVQQNNGFIEVWSMPGQGSRFKIGLPRHATTRVDTPAAEHAKPIERGHETILLVEDESILLRLCKTMLEGLGYRVIAASTPGEAIQLATRHTGKIDLLITDVIMPEMNGRELSSQIMPLQPTIKLLFMSGYTAETIAHQGVLEDGVHFLQKPFLIQDLAARVRETLTAGNDYLSGS